VADEPKRPSKWTMGKGRGIVPRRTGTAEASRATASVQIKDIVRQKFFGPKDAPPTSTIHDGAGFRLTRANVYLLFWGDVWLSSSPPPNTVADIANAVANIIAGPYLSATTQYGLDGFCEFTAAYVINHSTPRDGLLDSDIQLELTELIDFKGLPFDPFAFYMFVLPPGVKPNVTPPHQGEHSFILDGLNSAYANFGWIEYEGALGDMTSLFAHELVEAVTDPHGYAIQVNPWDLVNWNEVADVCQSNGFSNGVLVNSYWSQEDNACVVPDWVTIRNRQITCIRKNPRVDPHHAIKLVGGTSVESGQPFFVTQEQCIKDIDSGVRYFVVGADGSRADVEVRAWFPPWLPPGVHQASRFIATKPDKSAADNLLSLPECPHGPGIPG